MSIVVSEASLKLIRKLISVITECRENSSAFEKNEKRIITTIEKSDSMCFNSREEMDKIMGSLSDKFLVHGFKPQANYLFSLYQKFMDDVSTFYDAANKISIIRFIVAMAESPTNNFYKFNKNFKKIEDDPEINWPKYLQEGVPNWSPPPEESDSDWSDSDITSDIALDDEVSNSEFNVMPQIDNGEQKKEPYEIFCESKQKLKENIQNKWFNSDKVWHKPISNEREANISYLWNDYINEITGGLLSEVGPNVISEYKVMREIIWQLYEPTNSFCFEFSGDKLVAKKGVTISSVREYCFETAVSKILPYIEIIQSLKKFEYLVYNFNLHNPKAPKSPPDTYRCYASALKTILEPLFQQLKEIEEDVFAQESISTLITLFQRLKPIFETFELVKIIHDDVVVDFETNSRVYCATNLIIKLHEKLTNTSNNLEQVIVATLFLETLRKYLDFVESLMIKDSFLDYTGEFVILEGENSNQEIVDFRIRELNRSTYNNSIINFFCTEVFQIGRNVRLLRLLGKSNLTDILPTARIVGGSLHEEYVDAVLREISKYFKCDDCPVANEIEKVEIDDKSDLTSPVTTDRMCLDEFNKLEHLVDTSDGFLMEAFKQYFSKTDKETNFQQRQNIYQRLGAVLKGFCPLQRIIETVLFNMITDKFRQTGILAKSLFVTDHKLDTNFKFLKQLFLFDGELIFPFYRRFIGEADSNSHMNQIWLTMHLQDILMDAYSEFTDDCRVELKKNWELDDDPLKMCIHLKIHTKVKWPINLIVHNNHLDMYHNMFQFILKIKWALYTLNHLYFVDLEPRPKTSEKSNRLVQNIISKLKIFRFALINNFSSIQHFILGHIYNKCSKTFEEDFESADDFDTIYQAHDTFITSLHNECVGFRDYQANNHGFYLLLYLVRKLSAMWKNPTNVNILELNKYSNLQQQCHKVLDPIILNSRLPR